MSVWSASRLAENALVRPAIETSTAARVVLRIQLLAFGKNRIALVWTPNNFNCSEEPEEIVNFVEHRGRTASGPNRPRTDPGVPYSSTGLFRNTRFRVGHQEPKAGCRNETLGRGRTRGRGT